MVGSRCVNQLARSWTCSRCRKFATTSKRRVPAPADQHAGRTSQKLPSHPARTRFAPSPTGYLHIGSLRTALFNYLVAKATKGQFLLRIEDTDQKRTIADAEERLYDDLHWAGLQWDEGPDIGGPHGPYKQSERTMLYRTHADLLLKSRHAYRCFCPPGREESLKTEAMVPCSYIPTETSDENASKNETYVVRLKMPEREPTYTDLVYGTVRGTRRAKKYVVQACFEDPVLVKSDGFPTYHLANVVDDHHMKITHVIRGAEWMSSTPKHMFMYEAFGWQAPSFAHVGLLQDQERQKYSKRKGEVDLDMSSLERRGVFPEALVNYVALHGWSHELGDDFLRLPDLIKNFNLKFTRGNTVIAPTKLDYLQKRYAESYANEGEKWFDDMVERTLREVELGPDHKGDGDADSVLICSREELRARVTALLRLEARKYTFPRDFFDRFSYFFYSQSYDKLQPRSEPLLDHLEDIRKGVEELSSDHWRKSSLHLAISELIDLLIQAQEGISPTEELKKRCAAQVQSFLRWSISYGRSGPSMAQTMEILGRSVTIDRIESARQTLMGKASRKN